ncbi:hypothetical protein F5B18DRAFT_653698 [Nemania serpens]|nr:hypothetical protein F5B18DRAFT_653698 [Nemania serpens]
MPDSDENRGVFGNNNFTYGPVPRKDQWFDVEFLEVSPTPIDIDNFFFILLRGSLRKSGKLHVRTTDNLANATATLTMSATLKSGKPQGPDTWTVPFRTTPLNLQGHISIHETGGPEVDHLTYNGLHDILVYCAIPSMWVKSGMYTFEITTRLGDETCIFSLSLTQWLEGGMEERD